MECVLGTGQSCSMDRSAPGIGANMKVQSQGGRGKWRETLLITCPEEGKAKRSNILSSLVESRVAGIGKHGLVGGKCLDILESSQDKKHPGRGFRIKQR